jgi:2',3'-cyclic-nucleotide 2'-phosphodiesterase (5'-nucleotidase family)
VEIKTDLFLSLEKTVTTNKQKATLVAFLLIMFSSVFISNEIVSAGTIEENYTIVLTSGMVEIHLDHDQGGYAHLKSLLTSLRAEDENVIFLYGGDTLSPGILSTIDKGAHIISILNELSPNAMSLSKRDLAHQEDILSLRTFEAAFPITNCNIFDPLTNGSPEGIFPHLLLNAGELTIGLLSVIDPEVVSDYILQRITTKNIDNAVAENVKLLKEQGADIVVLMASFDINTFNEYLTNPPVDIVFLTQVNGKTGLTQQGNSLFELKGHKDVAAIINLKVVKNDSEVTWTGTSQLAELTDYPADPKLDIKITSYLKQLSNMLSKVIGMTRTPLDTTRAAIRTQENGFANFTADSLREFYHTDVALVNAGGFRANKKYPAGSTLTAGDIHKELPFHNRIMVLRLSGEILKQSLENGLSRIEDEKGRFPHVSGIKVEYNPMNPPFQRVTKIKINGKPIDPEAMYTLTTSDFLAKGGDGYTELKKADRIVKLNGTRLLWEYVRNQIVAKGAISPEIDGRMKALHP